MGTHIEGFTVHPPQSYWGGEQDRGLHIVLFQPEIPGNTGNIGRLCAGTNIWLHLVEPLGFELDNRYLKRAGLDYWPHVKLCLHPNFESIESIFPRERMVFFTTHATRSYASFEYLPGSVMIFGRETSGLPQEIHERYADRRGLIPKTDKVRSLNLSNACAIVVYEAMRQLDFEPLTASAFDAP